MSVVDLSGRRWHKETDPSKHMPEEALRAALRDIDENVNHVIVLIASTGEQGSARLSWYQAGSYNLHGQLGMMVRGEKGLVDGSYVVE